MTPQQKKNAIIRALFLGVALALAFTACRSPPGIHQPSDGPVSPDQGVGDA